MRRGTALLMSALACLVGESVAGAAEPAPMVVFHGSAADHSAELYAEIEAWAARNGGAAVDLSEKPVSQVDAAEGLRRGIAAYREFDHDAALAELDGAIDAAVKTGAAGLSPVELIDLHIYRALTLTARGDEQRAWQDFIAAATLNPTRRLDPVRYSPSVVQAFERAVAAVMQSEAVSLSIGFPLGCTGAVDARPVRSSQALAVRPGEHYVSVVCPGKRPHGDRQLVDAPVVVTPELEAIATPTDAEVVEMARRRSEARVLSVVVIRSPRFPPTARLQVLDVASGRSLASGSVSVGNRSIAGARVVAGIERLLAGLEAAALVNEPVVVQAEAPWYMRPWLWGVAGAAVAAAVLVPMAIDSGQSTTFDVRLGGSLPE